jgi:hypothetical protein
MSQLEIAEELAAREKAVLLKEQRRVAALYQKPPVVDQRIEIGRLPKYLRRAIAEQKLRLEQTVSHLNRLLREVTRTSHKETEVNVIPD